MWLHCEINFNFCILCNGDCHVFILACREIALVDLVDMNIIIKLQHISGLEFRFLLNLEKELN
jgi:hypothetical protein